MKKAKDQINEIYIKYRDNRVVTDPIENKRLGQTGFIDNTIRQLSLEINNVVLENTNHLNSDEIQELTTYGESLLESFSKIAKIKV